MLFTSVKGITRPSTLPFSTFDKATRLSAGSQRTSKRFEPMSDHSIQIANFKLFLSSLAQAQWR
jgi:hypothetical protein